MEIRMLTSLAGSDFALSPGDETDRFTDKEAIRLIEAGYAVPVAEKKIERAVVEPAETRAAPGRKKKGAG